MKRPKKIYKLEIVDFYADENEDEDEGVDLGPEMRICFREFGSGHKISQFNFHYVKSKWNEKKRVLEFSEKYDPIVKEKFFELYEYMEQHFCTYYIEPEMNRYEDEPDHCLLHWTTSRQLRNKLLDCILESGYIYRTDYENKRKVNHKNRWYQNIESYDYLIYPIQL